MDIVVKYDKGEVFFILSMNDITKMTKSEIIDYLRKMDKNAGKTASTDDIEVHFADRMIDISCPKCGSAKRKKTGKYSSGIQCYKCLDCNKKYSVISDTIFEETDYTWDEMVSIVHYVINKMTVDYVCSNIRSEPLSKNKAWIIYHKVLHLLAQIPMPILTDVIQIDEKYFREAQKGSRSLYSLLGKDYIRKRRKHCYRSECGIFGPEFVNVLCAADNHGHFYAKCVCLGPMGFEELKDLETHIKNPSYICTDNLEIYSEWCKRHEWKHYVEPSTYKQERKARGYIDTDNTNRELTQEEYALDKKINMELYKIGKYPHIEGTEHKLDYDEFVALRYKFGLGINRVNSFHGDLEEDIIQDKRNIAIEYLKDYIGAYTYLKNYRSSRSISTFNRKDAENILVELCALTKKNKHTPTKEEIMSQTINDLPRPTLKVIKQAQAKMTKIREVVVQGEKKDTEDRSAYEGDENAQFVFNKRKFLNSIGTIRLNELTKRYNLYHEGMNKRQKINALSELSFIDDIIFYEIYLRNYGSEEAFASAVSKIKLPEKKKRNRKKKTDDEENKKAAD